MALFQTFQVLYAEVACLYIKLHTVHDRRYDWIPHLPRGVNFQQTEQTFFYNFSMTM